MDIDRIYHLSSQPPPVEDWSRIGEGREALFISRASLPLPPPATLAHLTEIWTFELDRASLESLLSACRPAILNIQRSHIADLSFLTAQTSLRALAIDWNNKVSSLDFLLGMGRLEALSLVDLKHVHDLRPLSGLGELRALQIAGGMYTKIEPDTLKPLAGLAKLEDVRLANIKIRDGSLESLASLPALKTLTIASNAASLEQFARLSARLPHVACDQFQPYMRMDGKPLRRGADPAGELDRIGDIEVMVTGKGMPVLRARRDRSRLLRYCERFGAAQRSD